MTTIIANTQTNHRARSLFLLVVAAASIGLLVVLRPLIQAAALPELHPVPRVDLDIKYQVLALALALVNLLITYVLFPTNFRRFARMGNSQVHPVPVKALGINAKDTWRGVGINFAVVITLVTSVFLYLNVLKGDLSAVGSAVIGFAPFILIFAALNAFTEEAITRFTVVVGFEGVVPLGGRADLGAAVRPATLLRHAGRRGRRADGWVHRVAAGEIDSGDGRRVVVVVHPLLAGRGDLHGVLRGTIAAADSAGNRHKKGVEVSTP